MLAYLHPSCGNPAFLLTKRPEYGGQAQSCNAMHLDGRPVAYGSRCLCDSCNQPLVGPLESRNIRTLI